METSSESYFWDQVTLMASNCISLKDVDMTRLGLNHVQRKTPKRKRSPTDSPPLKIIKPLLTSAKIILKQN